MDLPSKESQFELDFTSEESGKRYEGRFTVLCRLDIGQKHRLELEKSKLLGTFPNPTNTLASLAMILANLRVRIIDSPDWWKQSNGGYLVEDEDALVALFEQVLAAEDTWRANLKEKARQVKESSPT
jgi:hypothetical protein